MQNKLYKARVVGGTYQWSVVSGQRSDVRGQMSEGRGQRTEDGLKIRRLAGEKD